MSDDRITSIEELESVLGQPLDFIKEKVADELSEAMLEFIQDSPLIILSTIDSNHNIDSSPKGDTPGFVAVANKNRLLIPDRPGNKLAYGFRNIIDNPKIGLIFIMPSMRETLRIKGTATISKDPQLLEQLSAKGKPALLCTIVDVEECFFHCGKAMIRSKLWQPDTWGDGKKSLMAKQFVSKMNGDESMEASFQEAVETNYRDELY
jgi:PPOX class probable FMN-dependent enzyme